MIKTTDKIGNLYKKYADEDGFLYVQIRKESIFWPFDNTLVIVL